MGDLVLQSLLSKFEYDINQFNAADNNVFGFGGLKPYATGCQANISSTTTDLAESIGDLQGGNHPDVGDDWTRWTVGVMMLRLPPGRCAVRKFTVVPDLFIRQ
jgi:hypothetical protein